MFSNGLVKQEFTTVIKRKGVLSLLQIDISIYEFDIPLADSIALSKRLQKSEVTSLSAIKLMVFTRISVMNEM